jgi:hypothetical protein
MALTTDPHVRARLQTEAATSLVATGDQRGIEYLHEALKFLDPVKEPVATANALSNEARFHHLAGRHRAAIDLLKRAADLVAPTAAADEISSFAGANHQQHLRLPFRRLSTLRALPRFE